MIMPVLPALNPEPQPANKNIKVVCIYRRSEVRFSDDDSGWPQFIQFPPRVGESVQANDGTTKKIIEVVHAADLTGVPITFLILGDDNTSNTGTSL